MADWLWVSRIHRTLYGLSGGRLGGSLVGMPMLLLTTTGRRSGAPRTTPMPYLEHAGEYLIVGSNNGGPRDPAWWLNLQARPEAEIQVMGKRLSARARLVEGAERETLWPLLTRFNPRYVRYQASTDRVLPVVALAPRD